MDSGPMPGRLFDVKQNLVASTTRTTYVGDFLELALVPELTRAQKRQLAMIAMELQEEHRWDTSKKPRFRTDFTQKFDINVTEVDAIAPLYVSEINFRQAATSSKEISGWISENMGTLYGDGFQLEIPSHSIYDVLGAKIEDAAKQPGTSSIELSVCKNVGSQTGHIGRVHYNIKMEKTSKFWLPILSGQIRIASVVFASSSALSKYVEDTEPRAQV